MSNRTRPNRGQLRRYLDQRVGDLLLLSLDVKCRPFGSGPELVVAVDWSEVYAYIFGLPAPVGDPLVPALGPNIADAAHQIALITLFENFPGQILLIPPYAREMTHFITKVRTVAGADAAQLVETSALNVYESMSDSESLKNIIELAKEVKVDGDDQSSYEQFIRQVRNKDREMVLSWVSKEYASFLLFARFNGMEVLKTLTFLLEGDAGREPRLRMLADLYPEMAKSFVDNPIDTEPWTTALKKVSSDKSKGSRLRDAQALAYLDRLVPMMHEAGKQLLFLTRSNDINDVMKMHAGRFACIGDHYYEPGETRLREGGVNPPVIGRGWRALFELGMALGRQRQGAESLSTKDVAQDVSVLLDDASAKRNGVAAGKISMRALDRIGADLATDIQNQRALISTNRPRIPKSGVSRRSGKLDEWRSFDYAEIALKFFIRYVTDPLEFAKEREFIREQILQSVDAAQRAVPGISVADPWQHGQSPCRSVARELISNSETAALLVSLENPRIRALLAGVFDDMKGVDKSTCILAAADEVASSDGGLSSPSIDVARLETSLALARGWPDQLSFLLTRHEPLFSQLPGIWKVLWRLMKADVATIISTPMNANDMLHRYVEYWQKETDHTGSAESAQCLTAVVNAWLRHHIDLVEEWDERLENFPRARDQDCFELECILERAIQTHRRYADCVRDDKFSRSLHNNIIYGAARVTPSVGIEGLLADQSIPTLDEARVADRHVKTLVSSNVWATQVILLVKEMELWHDLEPDEADTLGYYYIKHAYWFMKKPTWFMSKLWPGNIRQGDPRAFSILCDKAREKFTLAERSTSQRNRHLVSQHLKLLAYTKIVVNSQTGVFQ